MKPGAETSEVNQDVESKVGWVLRIQDRSSAMLGCLGEGDSHRYEVEAICFKGTRPGLPCDLGGSHFLSDRFRKSEIGQVVGIPYHSACRWAS